MSYKLKVRNIILFIASVLIISCKSGNGEAFRNKLNRAKANHLDYYITDKIITLHPNDSSIFFGQTINSRKVIFNNSSRWPIYIGHTHPESKLVLGCTRHWYLKENADRLKSGWTTVSCFCSVPFITKYKIEPYTKDTLNLSFDFDQKGSKNDVDSFVYMLTYNFDTTSANSLYIVKNLYRSKNKIIEIEKFKSLK